MLIEAIYAPFEDDTTRYRLLRPRSSGAVEVVGHISMPLTYGDNPKYWERVIQKNFQGFDVISSKPLEDGRDGISFRLAKTPSPQVQNAALAEEFDRIHAAEKEAANMYPLPVGMENRPEIESLTVALRRAFTEGASYQREEDTHSGRYNPHVMINTITIQNPTAGEPTEDI